MWQARRRYPRVRLEVDWTLDSDTHSTMGRGLDISPRSARLALTRAFGRDVVLCVSLPGRARMFRARGQASQREGGLVIRFEEVSDSDLTALGHALVGAAGIAAIPQLANKFQRFADLHRRFLAGSTQPYPTR